MKQLFFIISIFISAAGFGADETIGKISGTVIDAELNEPIPYATIIINDLQGNLVSGNTSGDDGTFIIDKVDAGEYNVKVQFIGYTPFTQKIIISSDRANIELGVISLAPDLAQLDDVNIVAERSTIEQRIDRKVINIGKDLTTLGPSASDIMGNLPTLTVDQDGNIAMRGNENVRILVDGKPTNIPASQLLKQIPSTSIKSIELITNPSAKYNPEGMSGIINIVLHKNTNLGFNGNLNTGVTVGDYTRYNGSLNLNYRSGKFNFFGNAGANWGKRPFNGLIEDLTDDSYQSVFLLSDNLSMLYKAGVDFYMNDNNTFSFYTNQNRFTGDTSGESEIIYLNNDFPDIFQNFLFDNENISSTYNAIYKRGFEKEGHTLELEADYNIVEGSDVGTFDLSGGGGVFTNYTDNTDNDLTNTTLNLDYTNPLTEKSKLELGAEARLRNSTSIYRSTNANFNSTNFDYDNSIYSLYATFGQNFDKWSYQLGARLEQYEVEALNNAQKIFEDDYITVYPTAFTTYKLSEKKTLQLSFGRRVDRPSLGQVNPVREFSSPRISVRGNPELDPQFTNSLELNYTQNFSKGNLNAGVFYRVINNEINQTMLIDPEDPNKLLLTFANGEDNSAYGAEISGSYKPFKWWSLNPSFELYTRNIRGIIGTEYVEVENTAYNFRMNQSFNVTKDLTLQLFGLYRSKAQMLQIETQEMYFVNAGARYNILKDKGTISLNFNDIFDTQRFRFVSEIPSRQRGTFKPDSQTVFLGFSYRFGGGKNQALSRKNRDDNEAQGGGIF
ncbi:MAG TPA: TonB-dependent receptor [Gillisia sp.]|nr:TonB-dependent receptor [Gillisia sp.]